MPLADMHFSLHFFALRSRLHVYWRDPEWRFYVRIVVISTAVLMVVLLLHATYLLGQAFRYALFQVVSIVTTTGFVTADFEQWPVSTYCYC